MKEGIHIKGEGQVRGKGTRLRVEELCREEKWRESRRERGREGIVEMETDIKMGEVEGAEDEGKEEGIKEGQGDGDMECATALVDAFEFYLSLLSARCTACTLHVFQAVRHDFKETIEAIKSAMDGIQQAVSSIAGGFSVLMARMQERASEASFSCILSMHSCSSTCGTILIQSRNHEIISCIIISFFVCITLFCPFFLLLSIPLFLFISAALPVYPSSYLPVVSITLFLT